MTYKNKTNKKKLHCKFQTYEAIFISLFFTAFLVLKELSIYLVLAHSPVHIGGNGIDDDDDDDVT